MYFLCDRLKTECSSVCNNWHCSVEKTVPGCGGGAVIKSANTVERRGLDWCIVSLRVGVSLLRKITNHPSPACNGKSSLIVAMSLIFAVIGFVWDFWLDNSIKTWLGGFHQFIKSNFRSGLTGFDDRKWNYFVPSSILVNSHMNNWPQAILIALTNTWVGDSKMEAPCSPTLDHVLYLPPPLPETKLFLRQTTLWHTDYSIVRQIDGLIRTFKQTVWT